MIDVTAKYFNCKCKNNSNIFHFLSVQTIEQVYGNATGTGKILAKPVIYLVIYLVLH